jgi:FkbM family methyltransferase
MKLIPFQIKELARQRMASAIGVAYRRFDLPGEIVAALAGVRDLNVIDIGAHEGKFVSGLARLCGIRRALLCEPNPERAANLRRNLPRPTYEVFEGAICDRDGEVDFYLWNFDAASSLLPKVERNPHISAHYTSSKGTIKVVAKRLDSILTQFEVDRVDLLKIDVQGAEILVLKGAMNTLARTERIWIEVSLKPLYEGSVLFAEVYEHLVASGFALSDVAPGFRGPRRELLQLDLLFLPSSRIGPI